MIARFDKTPSNMFLLLVILIGMLTSCASSNVATYPDSWAEPVTAFKDACPDISGEFENKAIDAQSNERYDEHQKHPEFLSDFLTTGRLLNGYKHKWITKVKLSKVENGKLTAQFYKTDKIIFSKSFSLTKDFICTDKGIVFEYSYNKAYEIGGGGHRTMQKVLSKTQDGSLVLQDSFIETGLALPLLVPVPFRNKNVSIYKFNHIGAVQ